MLLEKIENIIISKYKNEKLAHFYLVNNCDNSQEYNLQLGMEAWIIELLSKIPNSKNIHPYNNPDILFLGREFEQNIENLTSDKKNYSIEDIQPIYSFMSHRPLEYKYKFAVLFNAHLIGEAVQNKLLKSLEEPENKTIFFILNPYQVNMLETINSRAIHLKVNPSIACKENSIFKHNSNNAINLAEITAKLKLHEFIEKFKNEEQLITQCAMSNINTMSESDNYDRAIELFKWLDESRKYHNSSQERLYQIYSFFSKN